MKKTVWSMCGMCTVRCPIRVEVEDNKIKWLEGNPHILGGALCAKGSAGVALVQDDERPQQPLIRIGGRGAGRWEKVSWYTALDYIAEKINNIINKYGGRSIMLSCRGGPFVDLPKAFIHALGSPNFTNHDSACGRNVHHASLSVYGLGRKAFAYDIKNARHLILFGRNLLESLRVAEVNQVMDMLDAGGRLTYVDVRQSVTGLKATRFFQVRPGTDYALALGMINGVVKKGFYDKEFIEHYVKDFDELVAFIEPYTPEWAAKECEIKLNKLMDFIDELGEDRPKVIFHPGWMLARYHDSFYASRALHILNVLMGNVEIKGGQIFAKGPGDCGVKGLRSLDAQVPKPTEKRADGVGWKYKHFDKGPGLFHLFYDAIETGEPYPVKALIAYRHDPFTCFPDPPAQKRALDKMDLLVSLDTHYSEFGWYSDVILPESAYLERESIIATQKGPKPRFIVRQKALEPRFDTKPAWWIFKQLADRVGIGRYFPYNTIEELWNWQLEPTGYKIEDFNEKGFIELSDKPVMYDREKLDDKFKTPSGKIEIVSGVLTEVGLPSLKPYKSPIKPPKGMFRLVFGRSAVNTHGHTINNPLLYELLPTNSLWINKRAADKLGIANGDWVDVMADGASGTIKANVTEFIHPEAVYLIHGFGRQIPLQTRAYHAGMSDQKLMTGCFLKDMDQSGGGLCLCECFIEVRRSPKNPKRSVEL
ncbi:molybdopterin-dependent oxidoreductase [Dissulfurimicrobium hydrothermale]|uniref:molybdopterin-dependent oxidoreductase n=1 Tax=Dissulfurimicrobium hydrothermale TaxID=1750598 RepID=UPI001EDA86C8|nr:molybdopterin-dependent oxidoreductase [Dissulfurimicrobium hydrothermale]UKL13628.1 molybdopterin-dependent oxidoreductase [Dissulfurimicrobium hydrothermale]